MRRVEGVAEGRRFLSKRRSSLDSELPESIQTSILSIFGKELSAIGVAEQIITSVKTSGDDALRHVSEQIDGVSLE